jgi:long-chain acyl-CoA synthetase
MLRLLITTPEFTLERLPSLRLIINSSAAIDIWTFNRIKKIFHNIEIMNSYGLTEASTCTILPDVDVLKKPDSVGYAIEGVRMCILDDNGQFLETDAEGEICVRGDHVFPGYRDRPAETSSVFFKGWLLTGDLGFADHEGYYYLTGRKSEMINCGGRKIAPLEVENVIMQIPEVANAAVVGKSHRLLGQVVRAFVVPKKGENLHPKVIKSHCTRCLPSHKIPFYVDIVDELPTNAAGKIMRRKLIEQGEQ